MIKQKLDIVTTFSGIGMQERGLINSDVFDVNVVATSDVDKNAILSYASIHCGLTTELVKNYKDYPTKEDMIKELYDKQIGYDFVKNKQYNWNRLANKKDDAELKKYWLAMHLANNLGDISKVQRLPKCDLLTFSFPCQSISIAGKQEGIKANETRSGLVYEIVRLIEVAYKNNELPKYLLLENVANLVSKKFINDFNNLNKFFDDIGYNVYWKIVNSKDTGIPQNRQRVFGIYIRKDLDNKNYKFPIPFDNGVRVLDILEDEVNDKYYLSQQVQDRFQITDEKFEKNIIGTTKPEFRTIGQRDLVYQPNGVMGSLCATDYKQPKQILVKRKNVVKNIKEIANGNKLLNLIIDKNEINNKDVFDNTLKNPQKREISNCITARYDCGVSINRAQVGTVVVEKENEEPNSWHYYVRKLTPKECFLLMGLTKEDCQKCYDMGISDASLYKQAGNGIVTNCIKLLAEHLYKSQFDNTYICEDEKFQESQEG